MPTPLDVARAKRHADILKKSAEMDPDGTVTFTRRLRARINGYHGPLTRRDLA